MSRICALRPGWQASDPALEQALPKHLRRRNRTLPKANPAAAGKRISCLSHRPGAIRTEPAKRRRVVSLRCSSVALSNNISRKRGGGLYHAKTHTDVDGGGAHAGNHGHCGQCAIRSSGRGWASCPDSKRDADRESRVRRFWPLLPARNDAGLRRLPLLVPPLLLSAAPPIATMTTRPPSRRSRLL